MTSKIPNCFYCQQPLDLKHYEHAESTGRYQATWKGDISCKKCFKLTPAETQKFYKNGDRLAKRKRKRVPILEIPMKVKVALGKPIKRR